MSTERFTLAVAQPRVAPPSDARTNVDHAVELVTQAAARGAGLVVFPEHFPGPSRVNEEYDAALITVKPFDAIPGLLRAHRPPPPSPAKWSVPARHASVSLPERSTLVAAPGVGAEGAGA